MGVKNGLKDNTLCWDCEKACNGGCSWSRAFIPVEGWKANPDINGNGVESFLVIECPEFSKEDRESRTRDLDTEGCVRLLEQMMKITREDYIKGGPESMRMIEKFIRGKGASRLHQISDPERAIRLLREQRKAYWQKKLSMMKHA